MTDLKDIIHDLRKFPADSWCSIVCDPIGYGRTGILVSTPDGEQDIGFVEIEYSGA